MNDDPASLQNLHDIVVLPSVPLFPPAPGWYGLAAIAMLALLWGVWLTLRRYRADAYRRAALAQFSQLQAEGQLVALPALLKRTALAVYPRAQVAGLSGMVWWRFLDDTVADGEFVNGAGALLERLAYHPEAPLAEDEQARLWSAVRHWLRAHRPPLEGSPC